MKIFFALGSTAQVHTEILTGVGASNRLSSYWYIRQKNPVEIAEYIETGNFPHRGKRRRDLNIEASDEAQAILNEPVTEEVENESQSI